MKAVYATILAAVGLAIIGFAILMPMRPSPTQTAAGVSARYGPRVGGGGLSPPWVSYEFIKLSAAVTYPRSTQIDRSFLAEVSIKVEEIVRSPTENADHPEAVRYDAKTVEERTASLLKSGIVAFTLQIAGMEVKPEGSNRVFADGMTRWSVRPKATGVFEGAILPHPEESLNPFELVNPYVIVFSPEDRLALSIRVTENRWEQAFSWFAYCLGPLLTLPGLIEFLRRFRQANSAKRQSLIIKP